MHGNTAQQSKRKAAAWIYMLAAMFFLLTGCGTGSVFDGSRGSDASGFRMEYSMLNQEESADLTAFRFHFLPLQLKRLLGFRTDPAALRLLSGVPEPPFGIVCCLPCFRFHSGAEDQFVIMPQDEFPHVVILGFRAEGHFAYRQFSVVDTLKDADPEGIFKKHRQA